MNDMEAQLERLRTDAEDCALISKLATNPHKRELFARLADHLAVLADEVERAIGERGGKRELREDGQLDVKIDRAIVRMKSIE